MEPWTFPSGADLLQQPGAAGAAQGDDGEGEDFDFFDDGAEAAGADAAPFQDFFTEWSQDSLQLAGTMALTWRVLLPGMAQAWRRAYHTWREAWPGKVLRLVADGDSFESRKAVAESLLSACWCCLRAGDLAHELRTVAESQLATHDERVAFLTSPWTVHVVQSWAANVSAIHSICLVSIAVDDRRR